jgi:hypothetical protein
MEWERSRLEADFTQLRSQVDERYWEIAKLKA